MASSEERIDEPATELVHKTKIIQFLGRTTPIILQNDNGPCPLLAICNVLLLKNSLNLSPDIPEVSQEKLLSLVAERLIDSNSNIVDKDSGYVENQQQNIADAIDLLPRLATGIDVNIKFTRIDDFEFTRECAIFDLLDIPLYHGWIVDPQDSDTANAIGLKSYNTLMGELVALETRNMDNEPKKNTGEDSVDFVAATTAALGVPSPCLSRGRSFDDSLPATSDIKKLRKGDMEEEAQLLRAMKLSEVNSHILVTDSLPGSSNGHTEPERADLKRSEPVLVEHVQGCVEVESRMSDLLEPSLSAGCNALRKSANEVTAREGCVEVERRMSDLLEPSLSAGCNALRKSANEVTAHEGCVEVESRMSDLLEPSLSAGCNALRKSDNEVTAREVISEEAIRSNTEHIVDLDLSTCQQFEQKVCPSDIQTNTDVSVQNKNVPLHIFEQHPVSSCENRTLESSGGVEVLMPPTSVSDSDIQKPESIQHDSDAAASSGLVKSGADSDSSSGRRPDGDMLEVFSSSADDSEPIYEGEECILESGTRIYEDREPMYEGEVVLAKQGDTVTEDSCNASLKDHVSPRQGELIRTFLKNSASQLTIYGLFCLQGGLKERELCVFFRNNHFNTMFKFEGELYILATDQGYINQPDLVWEKLNEVNGDTVFMTSNFKEFKVEENRANNSWDEQNAVASTTDYIASIDPSANPNSIFNSDLQLAIALQQQEFEQQPQGPQRTVQQPVATSSRLVTGPQVPKQSGRIASSRQEPKSSKDKCDIM